MKKNIYARILLRLNTYITYKVYDRSNVRYKSQIQALLLDNIMHNENVVELMFAVAFRYTYGIIGSGKCGKPDL